MLVIDVPIPDPSPVFPLPPEVIGLLLTLMKLFNILILTFDGTPQSLLPSEFNMKKLQMQVLFLLYP